MQLSIKKILVPLTCLMLLVVLSGSAAAVTLTWTGGGTNNLASNLANWSGGVVPQGGDNVIFDDISSKDCTWDVTVILTSLSINAGYTGKVILSSNTTLTIAKSPIPPDAPSGLSAIAVSSNQINLSWIDNSSNETGFKIERKTGIGGTYTQIATIGANVTAYSDTGLTLATTYFYMVKAYNFIGDSDYSNEVSATTLAVAPTATTSSATNITTNSATLNGTVNPNGFSTTAYFQWGTTTAYGNTTSTQSIGSGTSNVSVIANLTGLSSSTTYHYRIAATNAGGTTYGSDMSFTTTTGVPNISVSPASNDFGSINVGSSSSPQTFTISNTGTAGIVIGTITLTGTNLDQFVTQNDTCSGMTIAPSVACTIQILFIPSYIGQLTANLSIPSNDPDTPNLNISLSGTGITDQCM